MSIASEITRLQQAKADLKASINAKGGTITNETIDEYASKVSALPSPKEEETKTVTPNFSSGNEIVTPTSGKVMTQVTINKDSNLIADNIKSGVTIFGITGTYEGEPSGFTVTLDVESEVSFPLSYYYNRIDVLQYSIDNGSTWVDINLYTNTVISNVSTIKFKGKLNYDSDYITTNSTLFEGNWGTGDFAYGGIEDITTNATITTDTTIVFSYYDD
jgi:hypothetical protein